MLLLAALALGGCKLLHHGAPDAGVVVPDPNPTDGPAIEPTRGDEAGARALLQKFLAPGADYAALTKPLRPTKADYAALFDAETAAKLQPQYDALWDKEPMIIAPKSGQTELTLFGATSEELQSGTGNAGEFPGGWKRVAPHLTPHHTWYRFKFVRPGEHLGMAFDGLTFVNGHWVIAPKPFHAL